MSPTVPEPRSVPAGRGADWLVEGFRRFRAAPGPWIGAVVVMLLASIVLQRTGSAGALLSNLLSPVIAGGFMLGCEAQARGEDFRFEHLWAGFAAGKAGPLLMLGVFMLLGGVATVALAVVAAGASVLGALAGGGLESLQIGASLVAVIGIVLLAAVALSMALWFAPALVALRGLAPVDALKLSFRACLVNALPLLVNGLLMLVILIVATIPLGLGLLVAVPVFVASVHAGYRDLFDGTPASPVPPAA